MSKFDLLDSILSKKKPLQEGESVSEEVVNTLEEYFNELQQESYSFNDEIILESMKDYLRGLVLFREDVDPQEKVDSLAAIEESEFSDEDVTRFVNEMIVPLANIVGSTYNTESEDFVSVSPVVYETVLALEAAREGDLQTLVDLTEQRTSMNTDPDTNTNSMSPGKGAGEGKKHVVNPKANLKDIADKDATTAKSVNPEEIKAKVQKIKEDLEAMDLSDILSEDELTELGIDAEDFKQLLAEEMAEDTNEELTEDVETVEESLDTEEVLENFLETTFDFWGVEDRKIARLIVENAEQILNNHGVDNIVPDIVGLAESLLEISGNPLWDKKKTTMDKIKDAKDTAVDYAKDKYKQVKNSSLGKWVSSVVSSASKWVEANPLKSKIAGGVLGAAALGFIANAVINKFRKGKCAGKKGDDLKNCMGSAANAALSAVRAQSRNCASSKNPAKCKAAVAKQIAHWNNMKSKYSA